MTRTIKNVKAEIIMYLSPEDAGRPCEPTIRKGYVRVRSRLNLPAFKLPPNLHRPLSTYIKARTNTQHDPAP